MKRLILRPAILLASFLASLSLTSQAQDLNSAILLTRSEQYDKAEAVLQDLIKKEPTNSKNYFYLGERITLQIILPTQYQIHLQLLLRKQRNYIRKVLK